MSDTHHMVSVSESAAFLFSPSNPLLRPGVYFLMDGDTCVYVGQAVCVMNRVVDHMQQRKKRFTGVRYVSCEPHDLTFVESCWINALAPKYNGRSSKGKLVGCEVNYKSWVRRVADLKHILPKHWTPRADGDVGLVPEQTREAAA